MTGISTWYLGSVELIDHHTSTGAISKREYRRNMGGVIQTISYSTTTSKIPTGQSTHYIHTDHLGSTDVITDNLGRVAQTMSFDAWGKRRSTISWAQYSTSNIASFTRATLPTTATLPRNDTHTAITNLGYTGHEMIDGVGFVHMNGRLYDPHTGRFLQADPFVESLYGDPQTLNRYSYVRNNPLNATDPTGFFSSRKFWKIIGTIGIIALTAFLTVLAPPALVPLIGFVGGFLSGYLSTGNLEGAFAGGLIGGISAGIFSHVAGLNVGPLARVVLKGSINGGISVIQGGKFGHGFLSTFVVSYLGASNFATGESAGHIVAESAYAAVLGGTVSATTGGKFANGALSSAFAHLFNNLSSRIFAARINYRRQLRRLWTRVGENRYETKNGAHIQFNNKPSITRPPYGKALKGLIDLADYLYKKYSHKELYVTGGSEKRRSVNSRHNHNEAVDIKLGNAPDAAGNPRNIGLTDSQILDAVRDNSYFHFIISEEGSTQNYHHYHIQHDGQNLLGKPCDAHQMHDTILHEGQSRGSSSSATC